MQGLGAALSVPATLALVGAVVPAPRRPMAIGAWTGMLMLGFSIGPLCGGALTHLAGWRVIFWANLLLMLAALGGLRSGAGAFGHAPASQSPHRPDWIGFLLFAVAIVTCSFWRERGVSR